MNCILYKPKQYCKLVFSFTTLLDMVTKDKAQCNKQVKFVPIIRCSKCITLFKMKTNTKSYKGLLRDIETKQKATDHFFGKFLKHCEATKNGRVFLEILHQPKLPRPRGTQREQPSTLLKKYSIHYSGKSFIIVVRSNYFRNRSKLTSLWVR